MFRAGTVGLLCAAYEVELTPGTETHKGTIVPVRDCVNLATVLVQSGDCSTGLCPECAEILAKSPQISVAKGTIRPENN
jgi:hypothetical protein